MAQSGARLLAASATRSSHAIQPLPFAGCCMTGRMVERWNAKRSVRARWLLRVASSSRSRKSGDESRLRLEHMGALGEADGCMLDRIWLWVGRGLFWLRTAKNTTFARLFVREARRETRS